jgi:hypothetical protein
MFRAAAPVEVSTGVSGASVTWLWFWLGTFPESSMNAPLFVPDDPGPAVAGVTVTCGFSVDAVVCGWFDPPTCDAHPAIRRNATRHRAQVAVPILRSFIVFFLHTFFLE